MATKKKRQTFEKLRREQALRERRVRKQERKEAAREAKAAGTSLDPAAGAEVAEASTNGSPEGVSPGEDAAGPNDAEQAQEPQEAH